MRTIVDIPETDIKALDVLGKKTNASRAELVRQAVAAYLKTEAADQKSKLDQYFGMLKGSSSFDGMDGLGWQKKMRGEPDKREADMDRRIAQSRSRGLHDQPQQLFKGK